VCDPKNIPIRIPGTSLFSPRATGSLPPHTFNYTCSHDLDAYASTIRALAAEEEEGEGKAYRVPLGAGFK
jgi:hypothetical protein